MDHCPICNIPCDSLGEHLDEHTEQDLGELLIALKSLTLIVAEKFFESAPVEPEIDPARTPRLVLRNDNPVATPS